MKKTSLIIATLLAALSLVTVVSSAYADTGAGCSACSGCGGSGGDNPTDEPQS